MFYKLILSIALIQTSFSNLSNTKAKYDFLVAETLNSPNGIVMLEEKELAKYVMEFPRDYDVFVFLTTQNCNYCRSIEKAFVEVAEVHKNQRTYYPHREESGKIKRPVLFLMSFISYSNSIFTGEFKIKSFPNIYYSTVEELFITDDLEKHNFMDVNFWRITHSDVKIDGSKVIEWTNKRRSTDLKMPRSFLGFIKMLIFVFTIVAFIACLFIYAEGFVLNEKLWLIGSLIIYTVSAGGLFSALHSNAPFMGQGRNGAELIMQGSRNQYVIEGFVLVAGFFIIGGSMIGMTKLLKAKIQSMVVKFVIFFVLMQLCVMTLLAIEDVFKGKNFYNPVFFPPSYYIRGGFYKDQGIIQ